MSSCYLDHASIQHELITHYRLSGELQALYGDSDQNLLLHVDNDQKYIVKVTPDASPATKSLVDLQVAAMSHLAGCDLTIACPQVISDRDGKGYRTARSKNESDHLLWVLSYLSGGLLDDVSSYDPVLLESVGSAVAAVDSALQTFSHPNQQRFLKWDLRHLLKLKKLADYIEQADERKMVKTIFSQFETTLADKIEKTAVSFIHNDGGNQHNMLVQRASAGNSYRCTGIIDFGDAVNTHTIFGLGIAAAYASFGHADKLFAISQVCRGYHQLLPLQDLDLELIPWLVAGRLTQTLCIAAERIANEPDNEYAAVSVAPAKEVLYQLFELGLEPGNLKLSQSINQAINRS